MIYILTYYLNKTLVKHFLLITCDVLYFPLVLFLMLVTTNQTDFITH